MISWHKEWLSRCEGREAVARGWGSIFSSLSAIATVDGCEILQLIDGFYIPSVGFQPPGFRNNPQYHHF